MNLDDVLKFLRTARNQKSDLLLMFFSTLVSGVVLLASVNQEYIIRMNPFNISILALATIMPIYLLNQVLACHTVNRVLRAIANRLADLMELPDEAQIHWLALVRDFPLWPHLFFAAPSRLFGDLLTIVCVYVTAVVTYTTDCSLIPAYVMTIIASLLLWLLSHKFVVKAVRAVEPDNLKSALEPLWRKVKHTLRQDKDFLAHIAKRLDNIESLVSRKRSDDHVEPDS